MRSPIIAFSLFAATVTPAILAAPQSPNLNDDSVAHPRNTAVKLPERFVARADLSALDATSSEGGVVDDVGDDVGDAVGDGAVPDVTDNTEHAGGNEENGRPRNTRKGDDRPIRDGGERPTRDGGERSMSVFDPASRETFDPTVRQTRQPNSNTGNTDRPTQPSNPTTENSGQGNGQGEETLLRPIQT